ncbi:AcvB/VirJ family lysyl-phosphatidylglycerol hydrolase [Labrys monachus]|uniref:Type IV secretory pathway VirJ component n=1 Tax=Labrys monachus TaxID=217067 RepID=A0ABU0F821_9HYPH|nr:AcvB/VirJ family lysyl-phosphatidylglycerol hydrolase [Labrys monachus]MDQ0390762.1 type IV secretory pathway VirJ component [Labrys monachus]
MRSFGILSAFVIAMMPFSAVQAGPSKAIDPVFGDVRLFKPFAKPKSVIVLLSDADGFGREESTLAVEFQHRGDLVIGLNWPAGRHYTSLGRAMSCTELALRVENVTLHVEREQDIAPYITPVLAGAGLGSDAARALALEAKAHRLAGVIALHSRQMTPDAVSACAVDAKALVSADAGAAATSGLQALREIEDGDDDAASDAAEALGRDAGPHGPGDLADLPLYVSEPAQPPRRLAVVLTGDGGMGPLNRDLAAALAERGIGVVTIDSRRYFWAKRDPRDVATDLRRVIRHFRATWPVERIALVGYSFGGDALPLVYNRLPASTKRIVAVVSLLSIAPVTDMRIELSDDDYPNETPLLPEAARIDAPNVQCIYGKDDRMAAMACPALAAARPDFAIVPQAGGHGFDGDTERLADIIVAPLLSASPAPRRLAPPPGHAAVARQ